MPSGIYAHGRKKLTPETIAEIKELLAQKIGHRAIAAKCNVHISTVSKISRGILYKSEPSPEVDRDRSSKFGHLLPQMQALRAKGFSYRKIGERLNMGKGQPAASAVGYYLNPNKKKGIQSTEGVSLNGHERLDTRFLIGFGCAELERTLTTIAQRLGISSNLLRQGFSKLLGSSAFR